MPTPRLALLLAAAGLVACGRDPVPAPTPVPEEPAASVAMPAPAPLPKVVLPEAALAVLRTTLGDVAGLTYFAALVDLDGDGSDEAVAHVAGPRVCGTGGCPTLVLARDTSGWRVVTQVGINRPPLYAAVQRSNGWRDLVVSIGGGGGKSGVARLRFNGDSYPSNPTVDPAEFTEAPPADATLLVADFDDMTEGTPLQP